MRHGWLLKVNMVHDARSLIKTRYSRCSSRNGKSTICLVRELANLLPYNDHVMYCTVNIVLHSTTAVLVPSYHLFSLFSPLNASSRANESNSIRFSTLHLFPCFIPTARKQWHTSSNGPSQTTNYVRSTEYLNDNPQREGIIEQVEDYWLVPRSRVTLHFWHEHCEDSTSVS